MDVAKARIRKLARLYGFKRRSTGGHSLTIDLIYGRLLSLEVSKITRLTPSEFGVTEVIAAATLANFRRVSPD
jgi:hypothetical protein